ncbi:unnamed protein product [Pleuronectes platessa]|uniref:Uncharacterized protein n=1 Tax=Pleuronectes platessa TaxID=8262 RepID=A0A9N7UEU0_PLEPL|nr:unnamed protein product [Pleuronectes platessa]
MKPWPDKQQRRCQIPCARTEVCKPPEHNELDRGTARWSPGRKCWRQENPWTEAEPRTEQDYSWAARCQEDIRLVAVGVCAEAGGRPPRSISASHGIPLYPSPTSCPAQGMLGINNSTPSHMHAQSVERLHSVRVLRHGSFSRPAWINTNDLQDSSLPETEAGHPAVS